MIEFLLVRFPDGAQAPMTLQEYTLMGEETWRETVATWVSREDFLRLRWEHLARVA